MRAPGLVPILLILLVASSQTSAAQSVDWPVYGGDPGGQKHSSLTQVNRENVRDLSAVWEWSTGEKPIPGPRQPIPGQDVRGGSFEATPLVINDTMYVTTPMNRVVALDAGTGEVIWTFDPRTTDWGRPPNGTGLVHRGIAVWSGGGERRIFLNTRWRLIAIDAATGTRIERFGHQGEVVLTDHLMWRTNPLHYTQTSPPVVFEDLVILGNGVWDGFVYEKDPPGNVLAFDVHTGELAWRFNLIPQEGELGNETWEDDSWRYTGHTNVWAPFVVDQERGLLYMPVGTPSNDYYGGHRKGDNLFGESLLCLDARTGEHVWHFQAVRHGLWDYDLGSPPSLATIEVDGRTIDAVAVPSKMGFLYVFDRVTGEPVWPIEERPVQASDVPGEEASPTQPFPTWPRPVARQAMTEDQLIDFTPELKAEALEILHTYRHGEMFIPPSMDGTLILPGIIGGTNWGGAAVDPETGVLYAKASNQPSLLVMQPADPARTEGDYDVDRSVRGIRLSNGLPLIKPPYGVLTAVDLNTGEHLWQSPVGDMPSVRYNPALRGVELPERLGAPGAPGPLSTAGGLVFLTGASALYAFDKQTGEELWAGDLGERGSANPLTYSTSNGRQFVVVASGSGENAKLTAFALPEQE